jgi:hypothetical protein
MDSEIIEIIAENFGHEYFFHYDIGNWKQIKDYGEYIPKIIRKVIKLVKQSAWFTVYDEREMFKEIMNDINNV